MALPFVWWMLRLYVKRAPRRSTRRATFFSLRRMKTRVLGASGLEVSAVGLGGMYMSIQGRPSDDDGVRTIHAAIDAGVTLIDTADVYCLDHRDIGHNERLIARALREKRAPSVVVATKGGLERPRGAWTRN